MRDATRPPAYHPARWLLGAIGLYQRFVSPRLGQRCRYLPTCSVYAIEAIEIHGALRGSWLALRRLGRCHPFHESGYDAVPQPKTSHSDRPLREER